MKEFYTLNDLAMITSLTTRTLRNHLRQGTLSGEKIDGIWTFTDEDIQDFLALPAIRQSVEARRNAPVFDFLADNFKRANRACVILDYVTDDREAKELSRAHPGDPLRRRGHGDGHPERVLRPV
ncbi:MAG: helix-turn-helix domain-containing protein [Clostridia bacterium]|nr:helix-turn-helix domain-containing protein [Clostridia bacterium]